MTPLADVSQALTLALRQLADRRLLGLLALALIIATVITGPFLVVVAVLLGIVDLILPDHLTLPWVGQIAIAETFTDGLFSQTAWLFWTYIISPLAVAIVGALLDPIVAAVEARHYPQLGPIQHRGIGDIALHATRFLFLMLGISLAAWVVAWITGIPAAITFVLASGYLIAREYFETVALRRVSYGEAKRIAREHLPQIWLTGCLVALAFNLPFANLIAPIVGVAAFTHLFHRSQRIQAG